MCDAGGWAYIHSRKIEHFNYYTLISRGTPWAAQQGRIAHTSGVGRQVEVLSMWMVTLCPVNMGGEKRLQIEIEAVLKGEIFEAIGDSSWGRDKWN